MKVSRYTVCISYNTCKIALPNINYYMHDTQWHVAPEGKCIYVYQAKLDCLYYN